MKTKNAENKIERSSRELEKQKEKKKKKQRSRE
jgi:hypothetical protein